MGRFLMQVIKLWVVFWLCSKGKSVFVVLVVIIPVRYLQRSLNRNSRFQNTVKKKKKIILRFIY